MNVELSGAKWFKSSRSTAGGECVEAAHLAGGMVGVRDSKNPAGPALVFVGPVWDSFLGDVQAGKFDL